MSSLVKGTAILTIGLFLSKVLGLIYIFPFYAIVGEENTVLYQYAYTPYNIMLSIALSGFPLAVSKFVSKYNALGDYYTGRKLLRTGLLLMSMTGLLAFLILNLLATPIANIVIEDDDQLFSVGQVAQVIRWVSFALLVVPVMSLIRGFFQGYDHYLPTSVSQLVEQIVRIIVLLGGSFLVVIVLKGSPVKAIYFSVFAAFVGAVAGLLVLYYFWLKYKNGMNDLLQNSVTTEKLSNKTIYKEILHYSIPIVFVGVANPLFQLVDMLTFNSAMASIGLSKVTDRYFTMFNFLTHKIVIIPVMLATGFSMALIPTITQLFTVKDFPSVRKSLDTTYQILFFLTLPAVVGIVILAPDIYYVLYSKSEMGAHVLAHYAPVAILFALFSVTASILQGIDYQKWIIFSLLTGLLTKLMLNEPLIRLMEVDGAILATAIGNFVTVLINIFVINKVLHYNAKVVVRRILLIGILTAVMAIAVLLVYKGLYLLSPTTNKFIAILYLLICIGVGVAVYGYISLRIGLAEKLLGNRVTRIAQKLKLR